jgi:hypothetical protein
MVTQLRTVKASMSEKFVLSRVARQRSVFSQSWWLSVVGEYCDSVTDVDHDGFLLGRLLYWSRRNRLGLSFGYNPPLTHLAGFTFAPQLGAKEQRSAIDRLIAQLPKKMSFHFVFDANGQNADYIRRSFQEAGFTHQTHKSYLRPPEGQEVLSGIKNPEHKRRIKAADRRLIAETVTAETFISLYQNNLHAAGKTCEWPIEVARKLIVEAVNREHVYLIAVRKSDAEGAFEYDGAAAFICDPLRERLYYWMSTRSRPREGYKPHRDAVKVLTKRGMEYAQSRNWIFDADGASTKGAEEFQKNSLGLNCWEERDVFMRLTTSAQAYEGCRPSINRLIGSMRSRAQAVKLPRR